MCVGGGGGGGGAGWRELGNFQCPDFLFILIYFVNSGARAYCIYCRCGWELLIYVSGLSYFFSFSLSLRDGSIWTNTVSKSR